MLPDTFMCLCFVFAGKYFGSNLGTAAEFLQFPEHAIVLELSTGGNCSLALTDAGDVYYWGKNQVLGS